MRTDPDNIITQSPTEFITFRIMSMKMMNKNLISKMSPTVIEE